MSPPVNGFRTFLIVWATQSVSVIGTALSIFAVNIWLVQTAFPLPEQKPQLALALSGINLAFFLPSLLLAPLAGAWADRHDRKRTMLVMDLLSALVTLGLAALIITDSLSMPLLTLIVVLASTCGTFHGAAFDTSYAVLVSAKQLPRANGMMQTMWAFSGMVSPALAAALIALPGLARQGSVPGPLGPWLAAVADGAALAVGLDAATFLLAASVLLFVEIPSPQRADGRDGSQGARTSVWADVQEGTLYILRRRPLLWLLGTFTACNFCATPVQVLTPLVVKFSLAGDLAARDLSYEAALAAFGSAAGFGGVAGGVLVSLWGGMKTRRIFGVLIPMVLAGLAQVGFGLSGTLWASLSTVVAMNFMLPLLNSHSQAIWQTQTPPELQGRVFAVRRVIAQCSWPLSVTVAGLAGGLVNPGSLIAALGAVLAAVAVLQSFNPAMLKVEDKALLDRMAGAL